MAPRKYEQRIRAAAAEETRRRILDTMYERLRTRPSAPLSVDEVARSAGVARSTIYLIFGSRAGLFDALARDLFERAGLARLLDAVGHPDATEHLRGGVRASVAMFVAERDVMWALMSMARANPDAVAGAVHRIEENRAGGMRYVAQRLGEQGRLRPDVSVEEAADLLWVVTSFEAFDLLYTGRGLAAEDVADRLVAMAERAVLALNHGRAPGPPDGAEDACAPSHSAP
ncbi:MAG TPA: TetR/AcrR family transcriptional regulator [Pilimelia sp.]|nr:TetR/AcrR family transcriptional regulator [Pilimelia sp.]